jgi:hypothetical protein
LSALSHERVSAIAIFPGGHSNTNKHTSTRVRVEGEIQMGFRKFSFFLISFSFLVCAMSVRAQMGNSGSIDGVVKDPSGGTVAGATVEISYAVSGYQRQATTASDGTFRFTNVPFNSYHLIVTTPEFAPFTQDVDVRSTVPTSIQIGLKLGTAARPNRHFTRTWTADCSTDFPWKVPLRR